MGTDIISKVSMTDGSTRWTDLVKKLKELKAKGKNLYLMSASWSPIQGRIWAKYLLEMTSNVATYGLKNADGGALVDPEGATEIPGGNFGLIQLDQTRGTNLFDGIVGVDDPGPGVAANKGIAIKAVADILGLSGGDQQSGGNQQTVHVDNSFKYCLQNAALGGGGIGVTNGGVLAEHIQ